MATPAISWRVSSSTPRNRNVLSSGMAPSSEEARYPAALDVDVDAAEARVGRCSGHEADGPRARAEELRAGVDQDVTDRQDPALGHALVRRIVAEAQVGLHHHGR